jgi:hypothetical protein
MPCLFLYPKDAGCSIEKASPQRSLHSLTKGMWNVTRVENKCGPPVILWKLMGKTITIFSRKPGWKTDTLHKTIHLPLIDCLNVVFGIPKLLLNQIRNGVCKVAKPIIHYLMTRTLGSSRVILLEILEVFF